MIPQNLKIGFMQGRLSPLVNGKIQAFPIETWREEFYIADKINIRLMEWTLDQDSLYENPLMSDEGRSEIKDLMNQFNILIPSLTGDCFMQNPFWKAYGKDKKSLERNFFDVTDACYKLGISNLVLPLVDNGALENCDQENDLINFLNNISDELIHKNIQIAFESDYSPDKLAKFIEKFPPASFGINYDIGNSASSGFDPNEEFLSYGERITNVHIKDRILGGSTVYLGSGNADFPLVFSLFRKYMYKGNFILQAARSENDDHASVIELYKNMTIDWMNY